ncbi:MAG: trypsin-like peptidase domain-containing protein [Streptosporangiaceae bacterium]
MSDHADSETAEAVPGSATAATKPAPPGARRGRLASYAAAAVLILGGGLSIVAGTTGILGVSGPSAAIPAPPRANAAFVEDDEGTGADNQANILAVTAPGLVRLTTASGATTGLGEIITQSGIVVTRAAGVGKARPVTARVLLSSQAYSARLIGSDAAAGIAVLQIQGGGAFRPVTVGNSRGFAAGLAETTVGNNGRPKTITLAVGNISRMNATATVGGRRLTGLMETTSPVLPGQENGGPLVNLSGQVVGIDVAGAGSGLQTKGFAVPIDQVLAIARRITGQ